MDVGMDFESPRSGLRFSRSRWIVPWGDCFVFIRGGAIGQEGSRA